MRRFSFRLSRILGIWIGVLAAALAHGQQSTSSYAHAKPPPPAKKIPTQAHPAGAIHRIETYSGARRSVQYLISGEVSKEDRAAARELQRAENEMSYLYDLERLKQQYVSDERVMEQDRRFVQRQLYGTTSTTEGDASQSNRGAYNNSSYYGGFPGYGWYGGFAGYPGFGYPGIGWYGGYPSFGYGMFGGYGYRSAYSNANRGHSAQIVTRSLQNGVGDEGRIKEAMSHVISGQASPDYAEQVMHQYEKAVARAAASPVLAKVLPIRKDAAAAKYEPSFTERTQVTIWAGADKYDGVVKADKPGWVVLETEEGEVSLRKSAIERSLVHSKPASSQKRTTVSK